MKLDHHSGDNGFDRIEGALGISRREFMKFCGGIAATLGLSSAAGMRIAQAVEAQRRITHAIETNSYSGGRGGPMYLIWGRKPEDGT